MCYLVIFQFYCAIVNALSVTNVKKSMKYPYTPHPPSNPQTLPRNPHQYMFRVITYCDLTPIRLIGCFM